MGEIIARRQFDPLYIWLDIIFLLIFMGLLLYKKKFTTVVVADFRTGLYGGGLWDFPPAVPCAFH